MEKGLSYYIKNINNSIESNKNNDMREFDLTAQQFSCLMYLYTHKTKPINQRDIETHLSVSKATASGILQRLEAKGFIIRKVSDGDSRYKELLKTSKGDLFIDEISSRINRNENKMLSGFSSEEKEAFKNYLVRIYENLKKEKK